MKYTLFCLTVGLGVFAISPALAQQMSEADRQKIAENLAQADANGDGAMNSDEFRQLIDLNAADNLGRASRVMNAGLYDRVFQRLDANGDGLLTEQEMRDMAAARGN
ncbi:hypothetical protein [Cognatiyoonia sp. IB215182]|uniref:hypothetical protein n=1 Tax=Cognatiyoonia sp. IB215182 TaxID=3097353 RepID=UPI002A0DED9D|nr:hypothetical protein [Cognatiyoonia sp. IB215182]MDX8353833.1 hypothetical protein [Cognatiyoonia sp. IB215182]